MLCLNGKKVLFEWLNFSIFLSCQNSFQQLFQLPASIDCEEQKFWLFRDWIAQPFQILTDSDSLQRKGLEAWNMELLASWVRLIRSLIFKWSNFSKDCKGSDQVMTQWMAYSFSRNIKITHRFMRSELLEKSKSFLMRVYQFFLYYTRKILRNMESMYQKTIRQHYWKLKTQIYVIWHQSAICIERFCYLSLKEQLISRNKSSAASSVSSHVSKIGTVSKLHHIKNSRITAKVRI